MRELPPDNYTHRKNIYSEGVPYYGATSASPRKTSSCFRNLLIWSWRRESNPRPSDYKSDALPTELRQQEESTAFRAHHSSVPLREVRDNYLSYHKGIARATGRAQVVAHVPQGKNRPPVHPSPANKNDKDRPVLSLAGSRSAHRG